MSGAAERCVVFSHGLDGEPWGQKIIAMAAVARAVGYRVESVDYRGINTLDGRLEALRSACAGLPRSPVLVGSSLGSFLSAAVSIEAGARGLFLLAPAFELAGLPPTPPVARCPMTLVHGWKDDVVPVEIAIRFGRAQGATLHLVDDDHRLHASLPRIEGWLRDFLGDLG